MKNLSPAIFIVPLTALTLLVIGYFNLLKKVIKKAAFKRFVLITTVLAFVLNIVWEFVQMPLYRDAAFDAQHIAFCLLASVADAIMVLLLYFVFAIIYKQPFWIKYLNILRAFMLVVIGGIGAILAEMRHLSQGNWAYDSSMPILPFVNVGLSPLLQFMLLPVIIYYVSFYFLKKNDGSEMN
ncbi:MAG: hypothetical protein ABIX01_20220 [Chitinophagaceae bacterium]